MTTFTVILAVAATLLVAALQIKRYRAFQAAIKQHAAEKQEQVHRAAVTKLQRLNMLVPIAICAGVAGYVALVPTAVPDDQRTATYVFLLVITLIFASSFVTFPMTQCLYYTETGFFTEKGFIPFSELKALHQSGPRGKGDRIELRNGVTQPISRRLMNSLVELREQKYFRIAKQKKQ